MIINNFKTINYNNLNITHNNQNYFCAYIFYTIFKGNKKKLTYVSKSK